MKNGIDTQIEDLVGVFTDPIIVYPSPWQDTMPDWIKPAITMERLIENMKALKGEQPTATDAEVLAYMYPRSLEASLGSDWTQIYLYISSRVVARHKETEIPEDIKVESLNDYQAGLLRHLKDWIYEHRIKVRKERRRAEKREAKAEAAARAPVQLGLGV
ncbi:hypothetical protein ES703_12182 [subsurface metagenome]